MTPNPTTPTVKYSLVALTLAVVGMLVGIGLCSGSSFEGHLTDIQTLGFWICIASLITAPVSLIALVIALLSRWNNNSPASSDSVTIRPAPDQPEDSSPPNGELK